MKILVADLIAENGINLLKQEGFDVDVKVGIPVDKLKVFIKDASGLIVRSATKVTESLLKEAKFLKIIGRAGTGVDNIDIEAATKRDILVVNAPGQNANAVAELVLGHIFALSRRIVRGHVTIANGKWEKKKLKGYEVKDKTLGIIGMGNVGRILAELGLALKMKILAYDPFLSEHQIEKKGVMFATFDEVLSASDFVSIHVPKKKDTTFLFDIVALKKMKKGAFLINTARGGIVDETALFRVLDEGPLAGAALDVFEKEPFSISEDRNVDLKLQCTPHLGGNTYEAQENVSFSIANEFIDFFKRGNVENAVNFLGDLSKK